LALWRESLAILKEFQDGWCVSWALGNLGVLNVEQGAAPAAAAGAVLLGAAEAIYPSFPDSLDPDERDASLAAHAQAKTVLGEAAFKEAHARGRNLSATDAIDYALRVCTDRSGRVERGGTAVPDGVHAPARPPGAPETVGGRE
jgi:hypothetical protein